MQRGAPNNGPLSRACQQLSLWAVAGLLIIAPALLAGFCARRTATICPVLATVVFIQILAPLNGMMALQALSAATLAVLSAGAYSIDARLFSLRVIEFYKRASPLFPRNNIRHSTVIVEVGGHSRSATPRSTPVRSADRIDSVCQGHDQANPGALPTASTIWSMKARTRRGTCAPPM